MSGEKKMEQSEPVAAGLKSDIYTPMIEQEGAAGKDGIQSDTTSSLSYSGDVISTVNGYNGNYKQLDDNSYFIGTSGSYRVWYWIRVNFFIICLAIILFYSDFMGVDTKQLSFSSSGSPQDFGSFGSETMPTDTWNSAYICDGTNNVTDLPRRSNPTFGSAFSGKTKGFSNPIKTNNNFDSRSSHFPLNTNSQQHAASSNTSNSHVHTPPIKLLNQLGSGYRSAGPVKGFQPVGKFSSYTTHNQGGYSVRDTQFNYRPSARMWNGNDRFDPREKSNIHGEFEATTELTRGPRGQSNNTVSNSSAEDSKMGLSVRRDQYNREDFQTKYDNAKFYVIKSYSEDDIHKCIKYNVWSSTPNGNKKLDAAFRDIQDKASEAGTGCPIFLFYSVNGSGQFVGLAEMIGPVDFAKNMTFWQRDKWNGFFPVKWHVVKDIPNTQLRHIIIESNDNKPVTHSRDTQEIGLQQGLKMLKIFKSYSGATSMLDDFNFYENRERSLRAKRNNMPTQTDMYTQRDVPKHQRAGERTTRPGSTTTANNFSDPSASIIRQTRNLSLNPSPN